ncbi:MAG: ABC transporter permease [Candidatus Eisenbacteria bacterium]|uniref:ABC transporter permease n=1 Tax=Eiseniibacteriota bacterium TaxID=2212470 RepID=A0A849SIY3_UNCEI|nr:ABC transporter permease [Candidatus Eisenbacteria bacterium]
MTDPRTSTPAAASAAADPSALEILAKPPESPARIFWQQFRKSPVAVTGGAILLALYGLALFAPFVSPYSPEEMDRNRFYHAPQALHFRDASGRFSAWPHAFPTRIADPRAFRYEEDPAGATPLRLFVKGARYHWLGVIPMDRHLFGVDAPVRFYPFGTDPNGRDVLSRLLYGAQISLTVGLIGIAISFTLGLLLGGISGYFGGWVDSIIMRFTELLLSIPGLYLLIALRAIFPVDLPSQQVYLGIVVILALIGWAGLARIIRGMVLSIRRAEYVAAAEALGMSRLRIIARHILPNTMSFVIVAATISIPGYILGEVVLSFLGLGVQEPAASWGNMLAQARSLRVLTSFPWMLLFPGSAIFVTVLAFNFLGDGLRDALDPRRVLGGKTT